jgi:hypothetical protein
MRIYFLSERKAALKLNGIYLGLIDGFERHVEMDIKDGAFAEILPDDNLQPLNFLIDEKFLAEPPDFANVYLFEGDALIYIKKYADKCGALKVIKQQNFCGNTITLFWQGGLFISCEGKSFEYREIDKAFANGVFEEKSVGGFPLLFVRGDGCLLAISGQGKLVFMNAAKDYFASQTLKITVSFATCTQAEAECEFAFDGNQFTLIKSKTKELCPPDDDVLHFAFFESVLTRGDFSKYLSEELKSKANDLFSFLGDFCEVTIPTEKFYAEHGQMRAAGLVYPKGNNLYEVKYFAADVEDGKIVNILQL